MKKSSHSIIHQLLISTAVLLFIFQIPLASANSYSDKNLDSFTKIKEIHKLSGKLPEGGIICNGELVIVAKIIRRHLSCEENRVSSISATRAYEL